MSDVAELVVAGVLWLVLAGFLVVLNYGASRRFR